MADPNKDKTVLLSSELHAFASLYAIACAEENRAYTQLWANKVPLEQMTDARKAVEACVTKHYTATKENCGEEFQAMCDCLTKNHRDWSKCAVQKAALEECFAKNAL